MFTMTTANIAQAWWRNQSIMIEHNCPQVHRGYGYMANQLLEIKHVVDHQRRFRVLEPKACVNIRKFRINRKKMRRGKRHKNQAIPRSVKFSNLITVKLNMETRIKRPQRNIRITTLNAQLVKNKDQLIADYILNTKANYMVITETWLKDTDDTWTEGSDLNQNGLEIWKQNRTGGIGGGLALVTHPHTRVKEVTYHTSNSFEHGIWMVKHPGDNADHLWYIQTAPISPKQINNQSIS